MQKYGVVYCYRDRKHERLYIGCHWGYEGDGYICSSTWMRNAYRRRPQDFERHVIAVIKTNRADLLLEEQKWLQMIKPEEFGKRFYNLCTFYHPQHRKKMLADFEKTRHQPKTEECKAAISRSLKMIWQKSSHRQKMTEAAKADPNRSKNASYAAKQLWANPESRAKWQASRQASINARSPAELTLQGKKGALARWSYKTPFLFEGQLYRTLREAAAACGMSSSGVLKRLRRQASA